MATTRKAGGKKTTTRKRTTAKKRSTATGKKKISGLLYDPAGCFDSKTAASNAADAIRAKGKKARVIPNKSGKGACIYTR